MAYQKVFRTAIKNAPYGLDGVNHNPSFGVGIYIDDGFKKPPVIEFALLPERIRGTSGQNLIDTLAKDFYGVDTTRRCKPGNSNSISLSLLQKFHQMFREYSPSGLSITHPMLAALTRASFDPFAVNYVQGIQGGLRPTVEGGDTLNPSQISDVMEQAAQVLTGPMINGIHDLISGTPSENAVQAGALLIAGVHSMAKEAQRYPYGPAAYMINYMEQRACRLYELGGSSVRGSQDMVAEMANILAQQVYLDAGMQNARILTIEPAAIYYDKHLQLINQTSQQELEKKGIPTEATLWERNNGSMEMVQHRGALNVSKAANLGFITGNDEVRAYRKLFHAAGDDRYELISLGNNDSRDGLLAQSGNDPDDQDDPDFDDVMSGPG